MTNYSYSSFLQTYKLTRNALLKKENCLLFHYSPHIYVLEKLNNREQDLYFNCVTYIFRHLLSMNCGDKWDMFLRNDLHK